MEAAVSILYRKRFTSAAGKDTVIPVLCTLQSVRFPGSLFIQGKFKAGINFLLNLLTQIDPVDVPYQNVDGTSVRNNMMGIKQEISSFTGDVDFSAQQCLPGHQVKWMDQLLLRRKVITSDHCRIETQIITTVYQYISVFFCQFHQQIRVSRNCLSDRFTQLFNIHPVVQSVQRGNIVARGIRMQLTLNEDAHLCHGGGSGDQPWNRGNKRPVFCHHL